MRKKLKWNISIFMQAIIRLCIPVVYLAQIIPITCWICNIPHLAHLDLSPYMACSKTTAESASLGMCISCRNLGRPAQGNNQAGLVAAVSIFGFQGFMSAFPTVCIVVIVNLVGNIMHDDSSLVQLGAVSLGQLFSQFPNGCCNLASAFSNKICPDAGAFLVEAVLSLLGNVNDSQHNASAGFIVIRASQIRIFNIMKSSRDFDFEISNSLLICLGGISLAAYSQLDYFIL